MIHLFRTAAQVDVGQGTQRNQLTLRGRHRQSSDFLGAIGITGFTHNHQVDLVTTHVIVPSIGAIDQRVGRIPQVGTAHPISAAWISLGRMCTSGVERSKLGIGRAWAAGINSLT